jgi:DNA invertase Pin-like site-specific DNA recombinase
LVSTADQNPQLQLDALATEDCMKVHTDRASGTKADRPQWTACLADLRPGDTLVIWRIDRLGRNLRDLIDIVTTLQARRGRGPVAEQRAGRHHHRARRRRVRDVRPDGRVQGRPHP